MKSRNKILVTGASGQLGQEFNDLKSEFYDYSFFFVDRSQLDITNVDKLTSYIQEKKINVLINCAAYTAVDMAEDKIEESNEINAYAVKRIAEICSEHNVHLIHYSTDYVFDGNSKIPYLESDSKSPVSQYGKSKSLGEDFIFSCASSYTVIRTAWVYSLHGNNFLKTMLRLGQQKDEISVVDDQIGSPTYAFDLAEATLRALPELIGKQELLHFSNEGQTTWAKFAQEIFHLAGASCQVLPITTSEYPTKAIRPMYSLLDKGKIKNVFKIEIETWDDALSRCIKKMSGK